MRENYLRVIDNILSADQAIILNSQQRVNSSARLLESLRVFSENVPIIIDSATNSSTNTSENLGPLNSIVYALNNFGLILEDVDGETFTGGAFSVDLGPVKQAIRSNGSIDRESLIRMASALPNATAAVVVPASIFDSDTFYETISTSYHNTSNESVNMQNNQSIHHTHRLVFSVFLQSSIFQNEETDCQEKTIGSVIVSLQMNSSVWNNSTNTSLKINFQEYRDVSAIQ